MKDETSTRLSVVLSSEIAQVLEEIATSSDTTKTTVIRDAIALLKLAHDQKKKGRHLGFAADESKLDTVVVGGHF